MPNFIAKAIIYKHDGGFVAGYEAKTISMRSNEVCATIDLAIQLLEQEMKLAYSSRIFPDLLPPIRLKASLEMITDN